LLVGCNPRYEAPVVNSRILKNTRKNNLKVGVVGTGHDLNYKYSHLGTTSSTLDSLLDGSHPFCESLEKASLPMVMVGTTMLEREDG
jgi:NADH dehydrogenase (ubiquinone) Fe-S protein 1